MRLESLQDNIANIARQSSGRPSDVEEEGSNTENPDQGIRGEEQKNALAEESSGEKARDKSVSLVRPPSSSNIRNQGEGSVSSRSASQRARGAEPGRLRDIERSQRKLTEVVMVLTDKKDRMQGMLSRINAKL